MKRKILRKPNNVRKKKEKFNPDNSHLKFRKGRKRKQNYEENEEQKNVKKKVQAYEYEQLTEAKKFEEENLNKQAKRQAKGLCSSKRSVQDAVSEDSSQDEENRKTSSENN